MNKMETKKPLATRNLNSSLPRPMSKLPLPGSGAGTGQQESKLRPPAMKRSRSPEDKSAVAQNRNVKRSRIDSSLNKPDKPIATSTPRSQATFKAPNARVNTKTSSAATRRAAQTRAGLSRSVSATTLLVATRSSSGSSLTNSAATVSKKPTATVTPVTATVPKSTGGKPKRPAWDLKGRLQDMEHTLSSRDQLSSELRTRLESNNERIALLETQNSQLTGTVAQKEELTMSISEKIRTLERKLRETEDELDSVRRKYQRELDQVRTEGEEKQATMRRHHEREVEDFKFRVSTLERQKESLEAELRASQQECSGLKSTVAQLTSTHSGLNAELDATKLNLEQSLKTCRLKGEEIMELKNTVAQHELTIEDGNRKMREHETTRRKLHNVIQELKGNIRVFCRVRPLVKEEKLYNDGTISHLTFPDPDEKVIEVVKLADVNPNESLAASLRRGTNKYEFSFDRVFKPASTQAIVFEEISQLVQSALDGYNVCIFAYGQTGSGKTHTMEGPDIIDEESMGMIPRAVSKIFTSARQLEEKGWQYKFKASFLEIYNESIRDLLGNSKADLKHEIKMAATNDVQVTDLTVTAVTSEQQVHALLRKASENRAVAETRCNERSSRSHSVFQLRLTGANEMTGEACQGVLNLVDLAGSERLKESGSEGQRLKEAQCINKSLSDLGNVIMALSNKESFVPYRNSKLTYLLQNSLGGNSKTLMFVNVSPKEECFHETLCSLRFATKVNQCNIGTAQKKVK